MKNYISKIRVRYGETDQMGVVHHGNYAQYFELARIEWLENIGISYKAMEKNGVMLPVYKMNIKYIRPAHFDDLLYIETSLKNKPTAKIDFQYFIRNKEGKLLTEGETVLVFTDTKNNRPMRCPQYILKKLGFD